MNSKYDEMYMTDDDLIQSRGIDASIANGVMSVEEGHGLKEAIRKKYGYSGGADGSEYIKLETKRSGFDAGKLLSALAGNGNKWDAPLEKAAREYTGMSYDDFTQGDDYASLAKRYSEQGQKAMNATLAEIASRTGGMASSYATTAAGQTYNDYMTRLEDAARAMYEGERADAAEDLSVLRSMRDTEDSRKKDLYALAYESLQDQKADARYDREWEYKVGQDAKADEETAKQTARDSVYSYIYAFGSTKGLDAEILEAAGYHPSEIAALEKIIADEKAAKQTTATVPSPAPPEANPFDFSTYERQLKEAGVTNANDAKARLIAAGFDPEVAAIIAGSIDWGNTPLNLESLLKKDTSTDLTTNAARGEKFAARKATAAYDSAKTEAKLRLDKEGEDAAYSYLLTLVGKNGFTEDEVYNILKELGIAG